MNILFRSEATSNMGTGHLMRSLAIAQAVSLNTGKSFFAIPKQHPVPPATSHFPIDAIQAQSGSQEDAEQTIRIAKAHAVEWIILDGYQFSGDYQKRIIDSGLKLLVIDDYSHADYYHADILLNQNAYAEERMYPRRKSTCRLLLGSSYVILRPEFTSRKQNRHIVNDVAKKILITMGGSDPSNVTKQILEGLRCVNNLNLEVNVILGSHYAHEQSLEQFQSHASLIFKIHKNVENMSDFMREADLAISSAGTTSWEMAFMGLPAIVCVLAKNQERIAESLQNLGTAINLGWYKNLSSALISKTCAELILDLSQRKKLSLNGQQIVDGQGIDRILFEMKNSSASCVSNAL